MYQLHFQKFYHLKSHLTPSLVENQPWLKFLELRNPPKSVLSRTCWVLSRLLFISTFILPPHAYLLSQLLSLPTPCLPFISTFIFAYLWHWMQSGSGRYRTSFFSKSRIKTKVCGIIRKSKIGLKKTKNKKSWKIFGRIHEMSKMCQKWDICDIWMWDICDIWRQKSRIWLRCHSSRCHKCHRSQFRMSKMSQI